MQPTNDVLAYFHRKRQLDPRDDYRDIKKLASEGTGIPQPREEVSMRKGTIGHLVGNELALLDAKARMAGAQGDAYGAQQYMSQMGTLIDQNFEALSKMANYSGEDARQMGLASQAYRYISGGYLREDSSGRGGAKGASLVSMSNPDSEEAQAYRYRLAARDDGAGMVQDIMNDGDPTAIARVKALGFSPDGNPAVTKGMTGESALKIDQQRQSKLREIHTLNGIVKETQGDYSTYEQAAESYKSYFSEGDPRLADPGGLRNYLKALTSLAGGGLNENNVSSAYELYGQLLGEYSMPSGVSAVGSQFRIAKGGAVVPTFAHSDMGLFNGLVTAAASVARDALTTGEEGSIAPLQQDVSEVVRLGLDSSFFDMMRTAQARGLVSSLSAGASRDSILQGAIKTALRERGVAAFQGKNYTLDPLTGAVRAVQGFESKLDMLAAFGSKPLVDRAGNVIPASQDPLDFVDDDAEAIAYSMCRTGVQSLTQMYPRYIMSNADARALLKEGKGQDVLLDSFLADKVVQESLLTDLKNAGFDVRGLEETATESDANAIVEAFKEAMRSSADGEPFNPQVFVQALTTTSEETAKAKALNNSEMTRLMNTPWPQLSSSEATARMAHQFNTRFGISLADRKPEDQPKLISLRPGQSPDITLLDAATAAQTSNAELTAMTNVAPSVFEDTWDQLAKVVNPLRSVQQMAQQAGADEEDLYGEEPPEQPEQPVTTQPTIFTRDTLIELADKIDVPGDAIDSSNVSNSKKLGEIFKVLADPKKSGTSGPMLLDGLASALNTKDDNSARKYLNAILTKDRGDEAPSRNRVLAQQHKENVIDVAGVVVTALLERSGPRLESWNPKGAKWAHGKAADRLVENLKYFVRGVLPEDVDLLGRTGFSAETNLLGDTPMASLDVLIQAGFRQDPARAQETLDILLHTMDLPEQYIAQYNQLAARNAMGGEIQVALARAVHEANVSIDASWGGKALTLASFVPEGLAAGTSVYRFLRGADPSAGPWGRRVGEGVAITGLATEAPLSYDAMKSEGTRTYNPNNPTELEQDRSKIGSLFRGAPVEVRAEDPLAYEESSYWGPWLGDVASGALAGFNFAPKGKGSRYAGYGALIFGGYSAVVNTIRGVKNDQEREALQNKLVDTIRGIVEKSAEAPGIGKSAVAINDTVKHMKQELDKESDPEKRLSIVYDCAEAVMVARDQGNTYGDSLNLTNAWAYTQLRASGASQPDLDRALLTGQIPEDQVQLIVEGSSYSPIGKAKNTDQANRLRGELLKHMYRGSTVKANMVTNTMKSLFTKSTVGSKDLVLHTQVESALNGYVDDCRKKGIHLTIDELMAYGQQVLPKISDMLKEQDEGRKLKIRKGIADYTHKLQMERMKASQQNKLDFERVRANNRMEYYDHTVETKRQESLYN